MVLARKEILKAIEAGEIGITPFNARCVGPCSVDLRLGSTFRVFRGRGRISVEENAVPNAKTVKLARGGTIALRPGQFILGATLERIRLSGKYCGKLEGRSRFARLGLMVHISSSLVQPGVDNVQVLEIVNLSPSVLELKPGTRICQIVFDRLSSREEYKGKFRMQRAP